MEDPRIPNPFDEAGYKVSTEEYKEPDPVEETEDNHGEKRRKEISAMKSIHTSSGTIERGIIIQGGKGGPGLVQTPKGIIKVDKLL